MALIVCPECGRTISDKAAACIGCGCPVSEMNPEKIQPAGRAQRRRRYQAERPETTADAPAQPAFDPAAFDAVMQKYFTGDVPIKLQTPVPPAQSSEAAQKAEAIQRFVQVTSMAAAQQTAPGNRNAAPANPASGNASPVNVGRAADGQVQTAPPRVETSRPAKAATAPESCAVSDMPSAGKPAAVAPAEQPSSDPAPVKAKKGEGKKAGTAASQPAAPTPSQPAKTVPSEMPEYGIFFGTFMTLLREGIGVLSYAAVAAVAAMVVDVLSGGSVGGFVDPEILLGLLGGYAIAGLVVNLDFLRARRFLRKGGYLDAIRNDGPEMTNCINAYRLYPSRAMIWYIKRLNPAHGAKIAQWAKEEKQKRRGARLRYLLYALVLAVIFYCLPRLEDYIPVYLTSLQLLLIEHLITLVVVILYAEKNSPDLDTLNLEVLIVFAGVFALMLYVYDLGDLWYHIIINAVVVFVAFIIGGIWYAKKKN